MSIIPVATLAAINTTLPNLQPGDVLALAAGDYGPLVIKGRIFAAPGITIRAADPANPPRIAGMEISAEGITFADLDLSVATRIGSVAWITASKRIYIRGGRVRDASGLRKGGLLFRNCADVGVVGTEFDGTGTALIFMACQRASCDGARFHDMLGDGIQCNGSSFVTLSGNSFTDFYPTLGDHPDAIQFFTAGQTAATTDVTITDNRFVRGKGGPVQGVFMGNEARLNYQRVTITGNAIVGAMWNGIRVSFVDGLELSDNLVLPYSDMGSWIMVDQPSSGRVANNAAVTVTAGAPLAVSGTIPIKAVAVGDLNTLAAWLGRNDPPPPPVVIPAPPPASPPPPPVVVPPPTDWQALATQWQAAAEAEAVEIARLNAALSAEQLADKLARDQAVADLAQKDADLAAAASSLKAARVTLDQVAADREADRAALTAVRARSALNVEDADLALASYPPAA